MIWRLINVPGRKIGIPREKKRTTGKKREFNLHTHIRFERAAVEQATKILTDLKRRGKEKRAPLILGVRFRWKRRRGYGP